MFSACEKKSCVNVSFESFNVNLERTPGLDGRITLHPVEGLLEGMYISHISEKLKHFFLVYIDATLEIMPPRSQITMKSTLKVRNPRAVFDM